jgi:hypothetical protein
MLVEIGFDQVAVTLNAEPRRRRYGPQRAKARLAGLIERHSNAEPAKLVERGRGQAPRR